jgi:Ca2+-binding RTX toxin-like protein
LGSDSLGVGNDTVIVAGSDYVTAGGGNDKLLAKDLNFRTLDGGAGWDTFAMHSSYTGGTFVLADYVSNARGVSGGITGNGNAADIRVNANGFHKLLGFEQLDFSQSTAKQTVTIAAADVDQLAGKNTAGDPQAASNTSNLYVVLGANDYLMTTGLGSVAYGYWLDNNGMAYDRKYTVTGGTVGTNDTANLFVRHGDDAPDFGFTSTTATYAVNNNVTSFSFTLGEDMMPATLAKGDFALTAGGNYAITSASLSGKTLSITCNTALAGVVQVRYTGTDLTDLDGAQLRYKSISVGTVNDDNVNGSASSAEQALFGNSGNDTVVGGSGADLLVGGTGNDMLTGGAGADTFRFVQFETGRDNITDFKLTEGDKIDLRGILTNTGFDAAANAALYLQLSNMGSDTVLRVDTLGIGNFSSPDQNITLLNAQGIASLSLDQLMASRVILV